MIKDKVTYMWDGDYPLPWNLVYDYAVYGKNGEMLGVREDTPEDIKQFWLEHLAEKSKL